MTTSLIEYSSSGKPSTSKPCLNTWLEITLGKLGQTNSFSLILALILSKTHRLTSSLWKNPCPMKIRYYLHSVWDTSTWCVICFLPLPCKGSLWSFCINQQIHKSYTLSKLWIESNWRVFLPLSLQSWRLRKTTHKNSARSCIKLSTTRWISNSSALFPLMRGITLESSCVNAFVSKICKVINYSLLWFYF